MRLMPRLPKTLGQYQSAQVVLAASIVLAVAVRTLSALYEGQAVVSLPGVDDQISYDALAGRVLSGRGFSFPTDWWPLTRAGEPTAHWSFVYTLYLAGVYALFGHAPLVARLIQALVAGLAHPWLAWRIGNRIFGQRTGLVAAAISAVYAYFVYYSGALMTETFYLLAILWVVDRATGMVGDNGPGQRVPRSRLLRTLQTYRAWLVLGVALGAAALLRQVFLLFVPFLFAWLLWALGLRRMSREVGSRIERLRAVISGLCVTILVLLVLVVPWTLRNYQAFGSFVLLNTNAGYAFFWANHPVHGSKFVAILPSKTYHDLVPQELRGLDEAALDRALLRAGLQFVADDPVRYARLSLSRFGDYFAFLPSSESSPFSNLARVLSFGVSLPFMLYGVFISGLAYRPRASAPTNQRTMTVLLYLFIAGYSAIHLLSWALIRYRLPVDAIAILFGALAIVDIVSRIARRPLLPCAATASDHQHAIQPIDRRTS